MSDARFLLELQELRSHLEQDLMYCTSRDSHIRLATRIESLNRIILQSSSEHDTPAPSVTVVP